MNILDMVKFNKDGLLPAVTQDIRTDEVLMLAYMNEEALKKTIETGIAHYYSRSRQKLWLKGETSGHFQKIRSISVDCDGDTLLLKVEQTGAACHTGHHSCFFTRLDAKELKEGIGAEDTGSVNSVENVSCTDAAEINVADVKSNNTKKGAGAEILQQVFDVITDRQLHPREGSYTNYLFEKGLDKILKKVGEEATEVVIASKSDSPENIKAEVADLIYHIMVLLVDKGLTLQDVYNELEQRK
jgi:phosphoribosyl-ATP pyrophosphohydrolase/phosphoribosyl-AMP cyclohydrolase